MKRRLKVALARERGARIYVCQHGADYGDLQTTTQAYLEEYTLDGFITWGWGDHKYHSANLIPLPSPVLSKMKLRSFIKKKGDQILIPTTVYSPNSGGGCMRLDCDELRSSFLFLNKFLCRLNPTSFKKIALRHRPSHLDFGFNMCKFVIQNFPQIKMHKGPFDQNIFSSNLIIQDNVGSTLHKSLAANFNVLLCWPKNLVHLNSELNSMLETDTSNFYFHDPEKLASFINEEKYKDINFKRQNFESSCYYKVNYCRSSVFYYMDWFFKVLKL